MVHESVATRLGFDLSTVDMRSRCTQTPLNSESLVLLFDKFDYICTKEHFGLCVAILEELFKGDVGLVVEKSAEHVKNSLHKFTVIQVDHIGVDSIIENVLFYCCGHTEECVVDDLEELCRMSLFGVVFIVN